MTINRRAGHRTTDAGGDGTSPRALRRRGLRHLAPRRLGMLLASLAASGGLVALVGGITATASTTLTVNSTLDGDVALNSDTSCPVACTLRAAIHVANNVGGTVQINVPAGTYSLSLGELQVGTFNASQTSYSVTISGAGAASTIVNQTDGTNRVFNLDPTLHGNVDVTIDGVTVSGGHDAGDSSGGAGIIAGFQGGGSTNPDHTTLSNCIVTNNHVSATTGTGRPGGGVQNEGGDLTITNCTISNNSSGSSEGGGVYYDSHSPSTGTLTVSGSTFSGNTLANTSTSFIGGAGLKVQGVTTAHYLISNSVFTNNVASSSGSGPVGGGGISSNQGDLQLTRSTFTGNQANGPTDPNAGGGAINVSAGGDASSNFYVRLNRIVGNTATNGPGGALAGAALDFANNWWGCSAGPGNTGCDGASGATTNPRLVLTATASPSTIRVTQTATVTGTLKFNSAATDTSVSLGATLQDGVTVGFTNGSFGTVSPHSATLSSDSASTTYTAGSTGGAESVPVTVDNQTADASITVQQPPHITSANNATFTVGTAGSFQLTAGGFPAPTFSETGALPSGVTLTSGGLLSGTPGIGTGNAYPITITATNGVTPDDTQSFTLTVNEAAHITSANNTTFTVGSPGTFTITSRGYPAPSITLTSGSLPSAVTYDSSTHVLSGTPTSGTGGQYSLQFTSHNGIGTDSVQSFTLTVDEPASIISGSSATFTVGSPGSFSVTTGGFPHPTLGDGGTTLPGGVTFTDNGNGTATLAGTPNAGAGGSYSFTITAHNGIGTDATQSFTLTVDEAASVTSANATTFTTGAPGTFSVTTSGFPKPSLDDGGATLPTGLTFVDNGNGTATLSGTPAAATGGTYSFTITASNGIGSNATQGFTLTVDQHPAFTSADHTTFEVGSGGTFSVTTSGFPSGATMVITETGALPSGVSFVDNGDGTATLSGTPGPTSAGSYPLSLNANNGVAPEATQSFTLTVEGAPHFTSADNTTFVVGQAGSFGITATGSTPMTITESGSLPSGVTLTDHGDGTATLAGTPGAGTAGTYLLTLTAHNSQPPDDTQSFTLQVNEAPAITSADNTTFTVGTAGTFGVTSTGTPAPALTETGALPSGVTFTDNGGGTGTLSGTPAAGTGGTYDISFKAANGVGSDATQLFTLTVDQAPAITSAAATTFTVGTPGNFTVTATGFPTPGITEPDTMPTGLTFTDNGNGTATIAGTPGAGTGGTYNIHLTAHNGVGSDATQTLVLTVDEAAAVTSADNATFTVGTLGSFDVTTSGFPKPSVHETGALPSGVSLVDNGDGTAALSGTPAAGTGGTYPITITAQNGVGSDATQAFTLTVNEAPSFTSAAATTFTVGSAGSFDVTTGGFPKPGIGESGGLPSGVTFIDNGDGTGKLSGTPATGTGGTYSITFTASNGVGSDAVQHFTLTVDEAKAITSAAATTFTVGSPGSFTVTTHGFPTPSLSESGALPSGVTFTDNGDGTAALGGTPAAGTGSTYPITITAHNSQSPDATQSFTLTVDEAASVTSANSVTFTTGQAGSFSVTTRGFPTPTITETGALPGGVTLHDNGDGTATLGGTPNAGTGGTYALTITAHNGIGSDGTQSFTLTIDQPAAITSANNTTFTAGSAGTFSVTTTGFPVAGITETGALPSGVTFHNNGDGTATLSGTPATGTGGSYAISFKAHNGVGSDATQSFTLTVDEAAAITSANNVTFQVGAPGSFTVTTRGFPVPSLTESGALPTGVTFHDNGDGTATLSGTPATGTGGTYHLTLTAHNGVGSDGTQAFTLQVGPAPTTTTVTATTATPTFGSPDTFTATVAPQPPSTGTPQGSVTFAVDGTNTAVVTLVSGQAQWTTSSLQQGAHTISAAYGGQANTFQVSTGSTGVNTGCAVTYSTRIPGNLTINGGSACINGARVSGGVTIGGGASVSIVNSTIGNGITSNGAKLLTVCLSSVAGSMSVTNSSGFVLIGSNGDDTAMPCAGNTLGGGVTITGNSGGVELGGNPSIKGAVTVSNNVLAGSPVDAENTAPEVEHNSIKGSLSCTGNTPAPTDDSTPNTVSGARTGQCGAPNF